jgi:DNA-binding SARP family transcriptional activator
LAGSYAVPCPRQPLTAWPALGIMSRTRLAALAAPCGALLLDNIAALVQERYAEVVWIRLTAADADPGALLLTLLGALARLDPAASSGIGEAAARRARQGDWGQVYRLLGAALEAVTAHPAVVVLEGAEHLDAGRPATLDLLGPVLLPALRDNIDVLLISGAEWDRRRLAPDGQVLGRRQLEVDPGTAGLVSQALGLNLPSAVLSRIVAVTAGAAGTLHAALSARAVTGCEAFDAAVASAPSGAGLLAGLGRSMLAGAGQDTRIALAGASRLGVWHPSMGTALGHSTVRWDQPWWLDLAGGWKQLVPEWRAPLESAGVAAALGPASLTLLADHLAAHGATDRALDLYLEAGEAGRAADAAISLAGDLAFWGCWPAMARLGQQLAEPAPAIQRRPAERVATQPARRSWHRMLGRRQPGQEGCSSGLSPPAVRASAAPGRAPGPASGYALPELSAPASGTEQRRAVTVHLLGELQVVLDERPVGKWVSGRGRAVFEYLVVHRHSRVRRERLMNVFWPEAEPDAARNSLNVAIHGLRQSLRAAAGDHAVVIHRDGSYLIEPALDMWVDIEVFEDLVKSARQHLTSDDLAAAQSDFQAAIGLYQGELLADDPYERWAQVTREHLRLAYLDCLDQLGRLRFDSGDYSGCADVCLKLLACDNCREDTQRRLMRCRSRIDQPQLALRQYHTFVATLDAELHLPPAPATTELAARIRRREEI